MATKKWILACLALLTLQKQTLAQNPRRGPPGPRGPPGQTGPPGPQGPPGLSALPTSWSDVILLEENTTVTAANAAVTQFVFTAGSCANVYKTATLGGQASVQCFNTSGAPNWPLTARWTAFNIHNTVLPGDAPDCDLRVDTASSQALPRPSCPFIVRYVYQGDLAADIGTSGSTCVFKASLYCVKPTLAAVRPGRSLLIGTGASIRRHMHM